MVSLDAASIQTHLRYSGGDLAFFGLFTLLTVAFCALAVWICTKRFHVRTLLNN
ncbi:MAG: hypothetical protein II437_05130 [Oscillospiraceae bacterium]|nr:hypothetical protein [Oscillospiraceae bacterium]